MASAEEFMPTFMGWYNGGVTMLAIDVGHRAGLFEVAASLGSATSEELAEAAGCSERHVREWLGLMTVARVFTYDAITRRFALDYGAVPWLTGDGPTNYAPVAMGLAFLAKHVPAVARTMVEGGGIPYDEYRPEFTDLMDRGNRIIYDNLLIEGYIGAVDGLRARLEAGIGVADLGCGSGHVVNLLGREFPRSTFVGYDLSADALDAGRLEAKEYGLENVSFEQRDVAALEPEPRFDLVTAFDAIHDQARPREVLAGARRSLAEGGLFVMVDIHASSNLEDNLDHVGGPAIYGSSLFHCMQVSLAEGGEGLGTMWGEQVARELLAEAGFSSVEIAQGPPEDFMNAIYVCRP